MMLLHLKPSDGLRSDHHWLRHCATSRSSARSARRLERRDHRSKTVPAIASAGISEEQAGKSALRYRVKCEQTSGWFTARKAAKPVYGCKTLVEEGSERILGAHLVGPHAEGVINIFAVAIRHGLTADDLKHTMFAYPTGASDIGYML